MNTPNNQGFIALITAILISALLMGITLTQSRAAFYFREELLESEQKAQSRALAESCVHEAILHLTLDASYAGNEEVPIADQYCTIKTIQSTATTKIITTNASVRDTATDLKVGVSVPDYSITSWQEEYL